MSDREIYIKDLIVKMSHTKNNKEIHSLLLSRIDGKLYFDNLDLSLLLDDIGTPCFIFSERQLLHQAETLQKAFERTLGKNFRLAFSIKSNPLPKLVQSLINYGTLVEVTSLGEIKRVLDLGGNPDKIIYTNIVKPNKTIEFALESGIQYFAIDSFSDMLRIERISQELKISPKVLIRVNPLVELKDTIFGCTGNHSKIGIEIPKEFRNNSPLKSIIEYCNNSPWFELVGIHTHLGSQITDVNIYKKGIEIVCNLVVYLLEEGIDIQILDIGGGFPVDYGSEDVPSIETFAEIVRTELKQLLNRVQIIAESGRFISAPAGILALSVINLKSDPMGNPIACFDGSFYNTIPDTILAHWSYPIEKVKIKENEPFLKYRFSGSTNDTLDQYNPSFSNKPSYVSCRRLKEGDRIIFLQAGAYSLSFNSSYCLEERAAVYFHKKS